MAMLQLSFAAGGRRRVRVLTMEKIELPVNEFEVADKNGFVYEFLTRHTLAVLATTNLANQPQSAVLEFSELKSLELVFDTYSHFRKYRNLIANPKVALTIGWDKYETLQYEGIAVELVEPELAEYRAIHLQKFPDAIDYEKYLGMKYFKILPRWIRYTDLSEIPWKRFELRFAE